MLLTLHMLIARSSGAYRIDIRAAGPASGACRSTSSERSVVLGDSDLVAPFISIDNSQHLRCCVRLVERDRVPIPLDELVEVGRVSIENGAP
jgi:hypothetical protein